MKLLSVLGPTPPKTSLIYQGVHRNIYATSEPTSIVLHFNDNLDPGFIGIGGIQNRLNGLLYTRLGEVGIDHHYIKQLNMREQLIRVTDSLPFRVQVYNMAVKDISKRFKLEEGTLLSAPIFDFILGKDSCLELPIEHTEETSVSSDHLVSLGWMSGDELKEIMVQLGRVNDFLNGYFLALGMRLASYSLQFGYFESPEYWGDNRLLLTDSFDLRSSHIVDIKTQDVLNESTILSDFDSSSCTIYPYYTGFHEIARRFGLFQTLHTQTADFSSTPCNLHLVPDIEN